MKVAVVGAGGIATLHVPLIAGMAGAELVAIADSDHGRAAKLAADHGVASSYSDPIEMLEIARPEVVHILVPPQYHADIAIPVMERGCHVLVEKPLSVSKEDAERMVATAQEHGVRLCVNHNLLFEGQVRRVLQMVNDGDIGEVISAESSFSYDVNRNPALSAEGAEHAHWAFKLKGGPLEDLIPHPASMIVEALGDIEEVHAIEAQRGRLPEGFCDEVRVLVKSKRGLGIIVISLNERPDTITFCVKGTKGTVAVDLYSNILTFRRSAGLPRAVARGLSGFGLGLQHLRGSFRNTYKVGARRIDKSGGIGPLISAFYQSIEDDGPVPVSIENALRVVQIIDRVWPKPASGVTRVASSAGDRTAAVSRVGSTALITGASGFIGSHLVDRLLREEVRVRAMARQNSTGLGRLRTLDVEIVEGDLVSETALREAAKGADVIYHLGGAVGDDWKEHQEATIDATSALLDLAYEQGVRRLVYVSSLAVCDTDRVARGERITEDVPYAKEPGPYARAKIEAERLVLEAHKKGLPATILRPGIVFGPRGRVRFPHLGFGYKDQLFLIIGKGKHPLPLTYVENTVDALCLAAESDAADGQVYHIVDDGQVTAAEYVVELVRTARLDSRVVRVPYPAVYIAALGYELASAIRLLPSGITSRKQIGQKRKSVSYDCSKARTELGWQAIVPLDEALRLTFEWYGKRIKPDIK